MRITIIGATGPSGLLVVEQALDRGWSVNAVVRSPQKLGDLAQRVRITVGDVFDPTVLSEALAGTDAAVSVIGAPAGFGSKGATQVYSKAASALREALPGAGVRRLVFCTSAGVEKHDPSEKFIYRLLVKPLFLQRGYDDMALAESMIRATDLEWVLVRPGRLVDEEPSGDLRVSARLRPRGGVDVSRSSLARFILNQVEHDDWVRGTPTLANVRD